MEKTTYIDITRTAITEIAKAIMAEPDLAKNAHLQYLQMIALNLAAIADELHDYDGGKNARW